MTEEEKIFAGKMFDPRSEELRQIKHKAHEACRRYNTLDEYDPERQELMRSILGSTGKTFYFQGPVQINYGSHTFIGENFFANFGLTIMDDARVYIGNNVCFGPNVSLMATTHPLIAQERMGMDAEGRTTMAEYADEIHIGNNVVIGAGSVVTKDIPDGYLAFGNPCKPVRPITEADSKKDLILPEDRKHFEYNLM
ncbi:MAG TPA: sugar O-acetyltransferase [Firmicutes bacterium]|nr:sugar O-acetyltransferase [Bacillota bacterium]